MMPVIYAAGNGNQVREIRNPEGGRTASSPPFRAAPPPRKSTSPPPVPTVRVSRPKLTAVRNALRRHRSAGKSEAHPDTGCRARRFPPASGSASGGGGRSVPSGISYGVRRRRDRVRPVDDEPGAVKTVPEDAVAVRVGDLLPAVEQRHTVKRKAEGEGGFDPLGAEFLDPVVILVVRKIVVVEGGRGTARRGSASARRCSRASRNAEAGFSPRRTAGKLR